MHTVLAPSALQILSKQRNGLVVVRLVEMHDLDVCVRHVRRRGQCPPRSMFRLLQSIDQRQTQVATDGIASMGGQESVHSFDAKVALAKIISGQRMDLRVSVHVAHTLNVDHKQAAPRCLVREVAECLWREPRQRLRPKPRAATAAAAAAAANCSSSPTAKPRCPHVTKVVVVLQILAGHVLLHAAQRRPAPLAQLHYPGLEELGLAWRVVSIEQLCVVRRMCLELHIAKVHLRVAVWVDRELGHQRGRGGAGGAIRRLCHFLQVVAQPQVAFRERQARQLHTNRLGRPRTRPEMEHMLQSALGGKCPKVWRRPRAHRGQAGL
mmetsp:Transcript_16754/g.53566  ORF Transcript_16754/g.53566 Transcript_16754/m.53566 type:complete len:323 (+) Transcript_16754:153-1121(+)